jgi:hypothetical protein
MFSAPDLIPGIYNYCDSWCERCPLTNRCRSFRMQRHFAEEVGLNTPVAAANASLVDQLTEALNLTKRYLETLRRENPTLQPSALPGPDVLPLETAAVGSARPADEHPAAALASAYLKQTGTWLTDEKGLLERAGRQQLHEVGLGLRTEDEAMIQLTALKDAYEQIKWYRTLIPVKTMAVLRALNEPTDDQYLLDYQNGKAKLVLVSIDRSLASWHTILQQYPEKTDDLLDILAVLVQLSRHLDHLYPEARAFKRPGLD